MYYLCIMAAERLKITYLTKTSSTNDYAKALLVDGRPEEYTIIQAGMQTNGKGHGGNRWESSPGDNILMSMILYPVWLDIAEQFNLSMAVALGITDFLRGIIPMENIRVKWPNDIYVGDKKIGGILINNEIMGNSFDHMIIGIGINVNQDKFSEGIPNPVSLKMITGKKYGILILVQTLAAYLMRRIDQLRDNSEIIRKSYHQQLLGMSEWRRFSYQGRTIDGMIKGINEFGNLLVITEKGEIVCDLKEIEFLF